MFAISFKVLFELWHLHLHLHLPHCPRNSSKQPVTWLLFCLRRARGTSVSRLRSILSKIFHSLETWKRLLLNIFMSCPDSYISRLHTTRTSHYTHSNPTRHTPSLTVVLIHWPQHHQDKKHCVISEKTNLLLLPYARTIIPTSLHIFFTYRTSQKITKWIINCV